MKNFNFTNNVKFTCNDKKKEAESNRLYNNYKEQDYIHQLIKSQILCR